MLLKTNGKASKPVLGMGGILKNVVIFVLSFVVYSGHKRALILQVGILKNYLSPILSLEGRLYLIFDMI